MIVSAEVGTDRKARHLEWVSPPVPESGKPCGKPARNATNADKNESLEPVQQYGPPADR